MTEAAKLLIQDKAQLDAIGGTYLFGMQQLQVDPRTVNMTDINTTSDATIQADQCFSTSRLKAEFRLKPGPQAVPVKYYKNTYGMEFPVYRIGDCVPMRPKATPTEKQVEAGKQLAAKARRNSKRGRAALEAKALLNADVVFIDTETTGLEGHDQVIEIAVLDASGQVLLDTRLRPSVAISQEAQWVHGISAEDLTGKPTWPEVAPLLRQVLEGHQAVAFNADFDSRLLQQTAQAHGDDYWSWHVQEHCAMVLAAQAFGAKNRHGSISLSAAAGESGVDQEDAHSAKGDALTALRVVQAIATYV